MRKISLALTMLMLLLSPIVANGASTSLKSISFEYPEYTIESNAENIQTKVIATYSDGKKQDVTDSTSFTLDKQDTADIKGGVVAVKSEFTLSIKASYSKKTATAKIIVRNPKRTGITPPVTEEPNPQPSGTDVKDYGAVGNGKAEDTLAFQKTIDAVSKKGGGDVYVPAGTYLLKPIYLKSNVNLVGESKDTVVLKLVDKAEDWSRMINIENVENVKIRNLTLDGNYIANSSGNEHMHDIFVWDSKNVVIDNNKLLNARADGVSITGSKSIGSDTVTVSNNYILDNHRSNIVIEQVSNIKVFNNVSESTVGRPVLHFEPFENDTHWYSADIHDNIFKSNAVAGDYVIHMMGGYQSGKFHDIDFHDNTIESPDGTFMFANTQDAKIHNNTMSLGRFYVWYQNMNLQVSYNSMTLNAVKFYTGNVGAGIFMQGYIVNGRIGKSVGTRYIGNTITTKGVGILIDTSADFTMFEGNTFIGDGTEKAIYLRTWDAPITNTQFNNNIFTKFKTDYKAEINGGSISGTTFTSNTFN